MRFQSIVLGSIMSAMAATSFAQADKSTAQLSWIGNTCPIRTSIFLDLEPSGAGIVLGGDSNPVFLSFANALFNPREYTLGRAATVSMENPAGRTKHSMTVSPPESFNSIIGAGQIAGISGGAVAGRGFSNNQIHHNSMGRIMTDELVPFFASNNSYLLRLPAAISNSPAVDPIGQILCVLKTKTKSNQSNDRIYVIPEVEDEISAQGVQISLMGADGKSSGTIKPVEMGALKMSKADSGRALDSEVSPMKIQSWVKDCFDNGHLRFDPSLVNVLQFDVLTAEADKLKAQFGGAQGYRIKVKFPWLCDADAVGRSISVDPVSRTMSRVSVGLVVEGFRLGAPTVGR